MSDLLQRLRDGADDVNDEAADRIEELERQLSEWREMTDIAAKDKRIAELEVEAAEAHIATVYVYQRVATLEAVLREIINCPVTGEDRASIRNIIARRALENNYE